MGDDLNSNKPRPSVDFESTVAGPKDVLAAPALHHSLPAGRLLVGRFRIVRFLSRGGMGEVYEAEDLELSERVALKTIRQDIASEMQPLERFRREIHLARKVTHPNVCRIFDVFHHVEPSGKKITFLSMELLAGETLAQRLVRSGRMSVNEARPIIRQMGSALSAAQKAGVIHRDFKSSNVMLVPSSSEEHEPRVVVTDFGLARSSVAGEELNSVHSGTVGLRGTPEYMAPEQVEGGEITAAVDVYAFGVVMYEMATGKLPFSGASGIDVALRKLKEDAPSPRTHVANIDTDWEKCILRCLARNPADRFASVEDALSTFTSEELLTPRMTRLPDTTEESAKRAVRGWRNRRGLLAAVGVVLLLGVLLGVLFQNLLWPSRGSPSRRSVAVLGLRNLTGNADAAWLSIALAEMLTTELAAGEQLRAIPGENVARMQLELGLPESNSFASDTIARIRSYLGADVVVFGSYVVVSGVADKVRLDLRIHDSAKGDLFAAVSEEGYPAALLELVSRTGAQLREKLGMEKLGQGRPIPAQASMPANLEATRFYSQALEKLRLLDALGAQPLLEKSLAADPSYALGHSALATSWSMLGYTAKAREEGRKALDRSANLPREEQLLVEARYREAASEWDQAAEVYRTLFGLFPDNIDYGLRLAAAQTSGGKSADAIATVQGLRKSPLLDHDNPRIDVAEARAAGALSDFKRQQVFAATAAAKGNEKGARLLVAGARLLEGSALASLGNLESARTAFQEARTMYVAAGDRWDAANAATNLAYVFAKSGDSTGAKKIYEGSLATYKELGDKKGTAAALTSLANVSRSQGYFAGAKNMHEQALAIHRDIGDRSGEASSLNNIANILGLEGNWAGATTTYEEALQVFRQAGDRNGVATVLGNFADLLVEKGDVTRAAQLYQESLTTFRELGNKSSQAYTLSRLGDLLLVKGDLADAWKKHDEALTLRNQLGEKGGVADSQLALANISLQQGLPAAGERLAKLAVEQFRIENRTDDEASATSVLARALLSQERYSEAEVATKRADDLSKKSNNGSLRLSVAITTASIRATLGETLSAANDLDRIVTQARQAGLIAIELEARLALGQVEAASGQLELGRARLAAVEREASKKGYKYIADRAAAATIKISAPGPSRKRI